MTFSFDFQSRYIYTNIIGQPNSFVKEEKKEWKIVLG